MPEARRLVASRCPECGAPVDLKQVPADVDQIRCAYCGTPLLLPKRAPSAAPPRYRPPVIPPPGRMPSPSTRTSIYVATNPPRKRKGNAGCGIVVSLLIFGIMIASDVGVFRTLENALGGEFPHPTEILTSLGIRLPAAPFVGHLYGTPVAVIGVDSERVESVLVLTRDGDDQSALLNFGAEDRALRWRAGSFSRNFTEIAIATGPRFVYVADQGRLTALDRETGEQAWQISLANHLSHPCEDCLQYMAGYVVALTRDGTLQSFDGNSGLPAWSRRLRTTPRQMFNVGGQPAVVDADDRNRAIFYLLDRITGVEWQAIQPVCHIDGREHTVTPHTPFLVSSDGLRLHVLGSGSSSCAWRYNLVTGDLEWLHHETRGNQVQVLPFSWSGESYLARDGVLYTTQRDGREGVLRGVDSQSGLARELLRADQYELSLEVATPTMLVIQATPTFARNEPELWGISRETGERRWYAQLDISHSFDTLIVHNSAGGIFVGQCLWEDRACLFEVLDPDSGVSSGQTRQAVPGSVSGVHWASDTAWMNIWGKIFAVDAATAQVTLTWP